MSPLARLFLHRVSSLSLSTFHLFSPEQTNSTWSVRRQLLVSFTAQDFSALVRISVVVNISSFLILDRLIVGQEAIIGLFHSARFLSACKDIGGQRKLFSHFG